MDLFSDIVNALASRNGYKGASPTMSARVFGGVEVTFVQEGEEALRGTGDTMDAALFDAAKTLGLKRTQHEGEPEPISREDAEAMLKRLSRHYGTPVSPVDRYCNAIRTWVERIEVLNKPGYRSSERQHGHSYAHMLSRVLLDINKSNLLARLIYGGERLRTRPCPQHEGKWSGISECPYGCESTGWLPEVADYPRSVYEKALADLDQRLATATASWQLKHYGEQKASIEKQIAYLFPSVPGTGVDAPRALVHSMVVVMHKRQPYGRGLSRVHVGVRFDFDPFTRHIGTKDREKIYEVPAILDEAVRLAGELKTTFIREVPHFDGRDGNPDPRAIAHYGSSFTLCGGDIMTNDTTGLKALVQGIVEKVVAPEGLAVRFAVADHDD